MKTCHANGADASALKLGNACKEKGTFSAAKFMCCIENDVQDDIQPIGDVVITPAEPEEECYTDVIETRLVSLLNSRPWLTRPAPAATWS